MKQKTYQTIIQKVNNKKITIKIENDPFSIPNKLHLQNQINNPSRIFEDKRFKKPRHKKKVFEE